MIIILNDFEVKCIVQAYLRKTLPENILIPEFSKASDFDPKSIDILEYDAILKPDEIK